MKTHSNNTDKRLLGAIDYIDDRFIGEAAAKIKPRPAVAAVGGVSKRKNIKYLALLAACVMLLGAFIPMVSYIIRNHPSIGGIHVTTGGDTTLTPEITSEEITTSPEPETTSPDTTDTEPVHETTVEPWPSTTAQPDETSSPEETTAEETTAEKTTAEETTSTPEPEYDGSRGLEYRISKDGSYAMLVGKGTCTDSVIVIASTYNGCPVTIIKSEALVGIDAVSVVISDTITTIESSSFRVCEKIETIHIPKNVTLIGEGAFMHFNALRKITVDSENPNYLSRGNCLIDKNTKLLIRGCSESVIPADVSIGTIGRYAFSGSEALKTVVIPEGVTLINRGAFVNCSSLSSVTLPNTLNTIEEIAFSQNTSLQSISIPGSVRKIELHAFYKCTSLKNVIFGKGQIDIISLAFEECTALEEIVLPEGLTQLNDIFISCSNLKSLTLPSTVSIISDYAFYLLDNLKNVYFAGTVSQWHSVDKSSGWNENIAFTVIHCSDGDATP